MARHRALLEVWYHWHCHCRSNPYTRSHQWYYISENLRHYCPCYQFMVSSDTNCPVAEVPAPPAVKVITPAEVIVPARVPATPPD